MRGGLSSCARSALLERDPHLKRFLFPLQLLRVDVDRQRSRECDLQRTYARLARLKEERGDDYDAEGLGRYKANAAVDEEADTPPILDQWDER